MTTLKRRWFRALRVRDVFAVAAQGAGGACLSVAGWLVDPVAGLAIAGIILIVWSGRSGGTS